MPLHDRLTVGSLFSGIGGIDLGLERTGGFRTVWFSEIDPYGSAVLEHHWPGVPNHGDIRTIGPDVEPPDVIVGGFPCQPVSLAGRGKAQEDPRWLWPEFARVVGLLGPGFVIVENVPGLVKRGLGYVLGDLAEMGYDAEWQIVSAASVGAPHLRERLIVVAYAGGPGRREDARGAHAHEGDEDGFPPPHDHLADRDGQGGRAGEVPGALADGGAAHAGAVVAYAGGAGREGAGRPGLCPPGREVAAPGGAGGRGGSATLGWGRPADRRGTGEFWAVEPDVGRVAHGVPGRVAQLRALGNAVVPQVAEYVGQLILEAVDSGQI